MCSIRQGALLAFGLVSLSGLAQENFSGYWQPDISLNYQVTPGYAHHFGVLQRIFLYREGAATFETRQVDIVHFSNVKLSGNESVGLGIQYRFRDPFEPGARNELRIVEQFNLTRKPYALRFGHRWRAEQRIFRSLTIHRFRYRFALDGPLQGDELDPGEFYWIGTLEPVLSAARGFQPEYDLRLSGWLGFYLGEGIKIQGGLEFRREDLWGIPHNILFLHSSVVLNL